MKKLVVMSFLTVILALSVGQAMATKPGEDVNPNGFPSGPHYNLNIIGKKTDFTCPEQAYYWEVQECLCGAHSPGDLVESPDPLDECVLTNIPIYGNVVFVPENGEGIEIYMQSGKGRRAEAITELQAIDPCAGFDGDGAIIQLPKNEAGYNVYARALAKPTGDPSMTISPELVAVEDEDGNDLIYLGLVSEDGVFTMTEQTFTRSTGKSRAVDITGLFLWTGTVVYLSDPGEYQYTIWLHADTLDECTNFTIVDPAIPSAICNDDGEPLILAYVNAYTEEWVFNIGDFVTYLWNVENNGLKLLQVRFYPIGAELSPAPSRHTTLSTQWGQIKSR